MTKNKIELAITFAIGLPLAFIIFKKCYGDDQSRKEHKWTVEVCDGLYSEVFCAFNQGAFGGSRDAAWLTDSVNFRIFLGSFDEIEGGFRFKCNGDSIYVIQKPDGISGNPKDSAVKTLYKISDLKKKQNLDDY